jgi:membrane protease YdiL (CAAX protease family)
MFLFAATSLTGAWLEEIYFRGILYEALRHRIGTAVSMALVTVLFCLVHTKTMFVVAPIAIVLGVVRVYTGSTKASFAVHAMYNLSIAVMMMPFHLDNYW